MPLLDLILIISVAFVLLLLILGVIALILMGMKKSKEKKERFTILVVSHSDSPLGGVDIRLGNEIATTDQYGKAQFEILPGEYELLIVADGHVDLKQKIRVSEKKNHTVRLVREGVPAEFRQLEGAISSARRSREEIGTGYNPTLPDYLFNICLAVHKMAIEEYRGQQDGKLRSECLKSAFFSVSQVAKGMVERRNLAMYAKSKGKKPRALELPQLRSPDIFAARAKLVHVDALITNLAGKNAIHPPLLLWKTAQKLLATPSVFNIRIATFLLDSAEKMTIELGDYLL